MAIYPIDSFTNSSGDFSITYDDSSDTVSALLTSGGFTSLSPGLVLLPGERGSYSDGDLIVTITTSSGASVSFYASYVDPFVTFHHNVSSCDLVITGIGTTNQSAIGVSDGSITISATSTSTPIQYSIDNTNWFTSGVFTGLPGGSGIAYVKDNADCTAQQSYSIATTPAPPILRGLNSTPAVSNSRWSALFNPIVFEYIHPQFLIYQIIWASGGLTISIATLTDTQLAAMTGKKLYVQTDNLTGNPYYRFTALPTSITNTGGFTKLFFGGIADNGSSVDGTGFLNIVGGVPPAKFRTEITSGYDGATNVITADHTSNLSGLCRADISKYLRTLLQPKDELDYTAINYRDANISASYTVRFCEVTRDTDNNEVLSTWQSAGDPFYVTYSAMQIGNTTGGNMSPYVTQHTPGQTNPAKFLNDFKNPVFYTDMPFDLSFIYSEKIVGYQLKLGGNGIDINGNVCGTLGELMLLNEDGSVLLNDDGSKLLIEQQAPGVLLSKLGINRLRITQNIPANSNWLDVFLYYTDGSGNNIPVTESRRLLLDNSPCNGLPYEYLKWIGPTGGWMYYMFTINQIHEMNTSGAVITERYISDYATADSSQQLVSIAAQKKITAGKNDIPADEAEALATILYSPKVYRLVDKDSNQWQGVIVDTRSLKMYQTYGQTGDLEITYLLPEVNTQRS